ncbi:MATE family efflux transporter, partial [Bacillus vallismortis]|nr:MATE family efflux transporter [Bacillus vallismortis]
HEILALFLTEEDSLYIAHRLLMITFWSYLLFGNAQIFSATMRASGTVLCPTVISIFAIGGVEVPGAFVLSHYTKLEIRGV